MRQNPAVPALEPASIPSPDLDWSQFQVGPLTIHIYALCLITGMIVAAMVTGRRLKARGFEAGTAIDVALWAVPLGILGARLYHVFTHVSDYFYPGADWWNIIAIWDGGNALYGSLIGGAIGAWIGCRHTRVPLRVFADALAPALLIAQAIGRLGNYFNNELFGLPTTLPWGLQVSPDAAMFPANLSADTLFHPLFLYEIIWNVIGAAALILLDKKVRLRVGQLFSLYLIWYGIGRAFLEAIRIDPSSDAAFGIPANVWASFAAIALGAVLYFVLQRTPQPSTPAADQASVDETPEATRKPVKS